MKQRMQFGSEAMKLLNTTIPNIVRLLNDEFRLVYEYDEVYDVKPFNLVSPDLYFEDENKRERYKVVSFDNALHTEYNGLNAFELEIAEALDCMGLTWCRNPSKTGYGIPIPEIGEGTTSFYPDFILWSEKCLWAIDPKGAHLINDAIFSKLMGISDINDIPLKIRVALILQGNYILGINGRPMQQGKDGCTLIYKRNVGVRAKHFLTANALVKDLT